MKVGTPKTLHLVDRLLVGPLDLVDRAAAVHLGQDLVAGDTVGVEDARPRPSESRMSSPSSWRAANRAWCTAPNCSGYWSRTTTPAARATRSPNFAGSSHTGVPPSGTWPWLRVKGRKVTSQSAPSAKPGQQVLVGVAGEGAAVVPCHGEMAS